MSTLSAIKLLTRCLSGISLQKNAFKTTIQPKTLMPTLTTTQGGTIPWKTTSFLNHSFAKRFQSSSSDGEKPKREENTENEEWVKFQKRIQVKGFDTGQQTVASNLGQLGKKKRGGKRIRKREEKLRAEMGSSEEQVQVGGGLYPALRYSEEETARLLAEAYGKLPERTGKRGTRNLKRQRLRFKGIRKRAAQKKREKIAAHFRKMEKRSQNVKDIRGVYEVSPELREGDKRYHDEVLKRWVMLLQDDQKDNSEVDLTQNADALDSTLIDAEVLKKESN